MGKVTPMHKERKHKIVTELSTLEYPEGVSQPLDKVDSYILTDGCPSGNRSKKYCEVMADLQEGKWLILAEEWSYLTLAQLKWMVRLLESPDGSVTTDR